MENWFKKYFKSITELMQPRNSDIHREALNSPLSHVSPYYYTFINAKEIQALAHQIKLTSNSKRQKLCKSQTVQAIKTNILILFAC